LPHEHGFNLAPPSYPPDDNGVADVFVRATKRGGPHAPESAYDVAARAFVASPMDDVSHERSRSPENTWFLRPESDEGLVR
jgi:hypothetical protein